MAKASVSPAPLRPRGRPRVHATNIDRAAALRERQRAKGMVLAWVRLDVLEASRAKDKKIEDKLAAKAAKGIK